MNFPMKILKILPKPRTKKSLKYATKVKVKSNTGNTEKQKSDKQHQKQLATHNRQIRLQSRHET